MEGVHHYRRRDRGFKCVQGVKIMLSVGSALEGGYHRMVEM